jgi:SAM-dependent methyltransferase
MTQDSERVVDLYERNAQNWDADRGKTLFERPWLDRCGSGEPIARHFIEAGYRLTGVDSSPTLIGMCRVRFPAQSWVIADMRTLDLGKRFAGILVWDSFFHLAHDDQRAMFPIFRAHATPGAALIFTSGPAHGEAVGSYHGEPLYHASLDAAEYRALLDANGFDLVAHAVDDPACGGHTIWLAQQR